MPQVKDLVSIIVPVYNVERYIEKCLGSLINQSYKNIEIICVNDGSPDNSRDIIESLMKSDGRIRLIDQQNQGLSGARNTGLDAAQGEYVMFLDSDDWIDPETCETAVDEIKKENAQLVMWSYVREFPSHSLQKHIFDGERIVFEGESMTALHKRIAGLTGSELSDPGNADSAVTAWGKLFKSDVIKNNGCRFTDTKLIGTEDALFNLEAFCYIKKAVFVDRCFNHYRKDNKSSLTNSYNKNLYPRWQELYNRMAKIIEGNNLPFSDALNNRIALSIIGIGLNELTNPVSSKEKIKNLKAVINSPRYKNAYSNLEIKYFPIHWKVFFILCKHGNAAGVFALIKIISRIIGR